MSYGQPWRRMIGGPPAGPASAYPTFSSPASICFSTPNEPAAPALRGSAALTLRTCAAAMAIRLAPSIRRRSLLIVSDIDVTPTGNRGATCRGPGRDHTRGAARGRLDDGVARQVGRVAGLCVD